MRKNKLIDFPKEILEEYHKEYLDGKSLEIISKELKCCRETLRKKFKEYNWKLYGIKEKNIK